MQQQQQRGVKTFALPGHLPPSPKTTFVDIILFPD